MGQLQLVLVNDSNEKGSLVVYQQYGDSFGQSAIAWFAKYVYPSTQISFQWDPSDYDFVWSATGRIQTGVVFQAAQVLPASPVSSNGVTLSYDSEHHIFYFNVNSLTVTLGKDLAWTVKSNVVAKPKAE